VIFSRPPAVSCGAAGKKGRASEEEKSSDFPLHTTMVAQKGGAIKGVRV